LSLYIFLNEKVVVTSPTFSRCSPSYLLQEESYSSCFPNQKFVIYKHQLIQTLILRWQECMYTNTTPPVTSFLPRIMASHTDLHHLSLCNWIWPRGQGSPPNLRRSGKTCFTSFTRRRNATCLVLNC